MESSSWSGGDPGRPWISFVAPRNLAVAGQGGRADRAGRAASIKGLQVLALKPDTQTTQKDEASQAVAYDIPKTMFIPPSASIVVGLPVVHVRSAPFKLFSALDRLAASPLPFPSKRSHWAASGLSLQARMSQLSGHAAWPSRRHRCSCAKKRSNVSS